MLSNHETTVVVPRKNEFCVAKITCFQEKPRRTSGHKNLSVTSSDRLLGTGSSNEFGATSGIRLVKR